jgi:hypothetical protein
MNKFDNYKLMLIDLFKPLNVYCKINLFSITDKEYYDDTSLFTNITFEIERNAIFIYYITNKFGISGKEILIKIETFAKCFGLNKIELYDNSMIIINNKEYSLFILNIIYYNHSFYGRYGYSSDEYNEILEKWNILKSEYFDLKFIDKYKHINNLIYLYENENTTFYELGLSIYNNIEYQNKFNILSDVLHILLNIPIEVKMSKMLK